MSSGFGSVLVRQTQSAQHGFQHRKQQQEQQASCTCHQIAATDTYLTALFLPAAAATAQGQRCQHCRQPAQPRTSRMSTTQRCVVSGKCRNAACLLLAAVLCWSVHAV